MLGFLILKESIEPKSNATCKCHRPSEQVVEKNLNRHTWPTNCDENRSNPKLRLTGKKWLDLYSFPQIKHTHDSPLTRSPSPKISPPFIECHSIPDSLSAREGERDWGIENDLVIGRSNPPKNRRKRERERERHKTHTQKPTNHEWSMIDIWLTIREHLLRCAIHWKSDTELITVSYILATM